MDTDQIPPHSLESEQAVLGSVLIDDATLDGVRRVLRVEDFYRTAHAAIYVCMLEIADNGGRIDLTSIQDVLRVKPAFYEGGGDPRKSALDDCGGLPYLRSLMEAPSTATLAFYYAQRVRDKSALRQVIVRAEEARLLAYQGDSSVFVGRNGHFDLSGMVNEWKEPEDPFQFQTVGEFLASVGNPPDSGAASPSAGANSTSISH